MEYVYIALGIMSLFVFGLLAARLFIKLPKGLIIACFVSYILVLFNLLGYIFKWQFPEVVISVLFFIGLGTGYFIIAIILVLLQDPSFFLTEGWLCAAMMDAFNRDIYVQMTAFFLAFIINAILIFATFRLCLYFKNKCFPSN